MKGCNLSSDTFHFHKNLLVTVGLNLGSSQCSHVGLEWGFWSFGLSSSGSPGTAWLTPGVFRVLLPFHKARSAPAFLPWIVCGIWDHLCRARSWTMAWIGFEGALKTFPRRSLSPFQPRASHELPQVSVSISRALLVGFSHCSLCCGIFL